MIRIEKLRYQSLAIDTLAIERGITSVIGANGSGKTTLLKLCAGILLPDSGSIHIDGVEPRKTEIGWVNEFPDRNFLFDTPEDEIASALRFQHIHPDEIEHRMEILRKRFGFSGLSDRSVQELSGGEKVLVALAAAMITNPMVIILDECDSHLDFRTAQRIDRILSDSSIPFIIKSTQDMENATRSDRVIFLENNSVGDSGKPEQVFSGLQNTPFYPLSWRCRA